MGFDSLEWDQTHWIGTQHVGMRPNMQECDQMHGNRTKELGMGLQQIGMGQNTVMRTTTMKWNLCHGNGTKYIGLGPDT